MRSQGSPDARVSPGEGSGGTRPALAVASLVLVWLAHAGLFAWAVRVPAVMGRTDRSHERLESALLFARAASWEELGVVLAARGNPGDYVWHGAVLRLAGEWRPAIVLFQLGLLGLSLWALFRLAEALGARRAVCWAVVALYSLLPVDLMVPHVLGSEAIFNPLFLIATSQLVIYARRDAVAWRLAAAGFLLSLALLTRPLVLGWIPLALGLITWIALRRVGRRGWLHAAVLASCLGAAPLAWMSFQAAHTGSFGFGASPHDLGANIAARVQEVHLRAGGYPPPPEQAGTLGALATAARVHPGTFLGEWAIHTAKFLLLADNLDLFRYLRLFEPTGRRAVLIHTEGFSGAIRSLVGEMPLLSLWLFVGAAGFGVLWLLVLWGARDALRTPDVVQRATLLLLLAAPVVYVALRVVSAGESRKRSPLDFILALFAVLGWQSFRGWRAARRGRPGGRTTEDTPSAPVAPNQISYPG